MRRVLGVTLGLALLLAQIESASADDVDSYVVGEMKGRKIPGVVFAVAEGKQVVAKRVYGLANLETETPVTAESVFAMASVIKPFTATAVMMLVEDGSLDLNDGITSLIDRAPDAWKGITVRHLLSHTSGLKGLGPVKRDGSALLEISTSQQFEDIAKSPLLSGPGEGASYSDAGYFLLGMIIEKSQE